MGLRNEYRGRLLKDINVNNVPMLFSGETDNAGLFMSVKRLDAEQHYPPCTTYEYINIARVAKYAHLC